MGLDGPAPTDICGCRRNEGKRRERILGSRTASAASSAAGVALPSRTFHRQPARVTPDLDLRATPRSRLAPPRDARGHCEGARARTQETSDDWFDVRDERRHNNLQHRPSTTQQNLARREQSRVYCILRSTFYVLSAICLCVCATSCAPADPPTFGSLENFWCMRGVRGRSRSSSSPLTQGVCKNNHPSV